MLCVHSQHVYDVTILVLGVDNAGKTTFLANILHEPVSCVVPTIGYRNVRYKYKRAHVTLVDLGGGQSIRSIWPNYYADAHGAIFILDASDTERLEESRNVFLEMSQHPLMVDKPVLLFGNKQDMMKSGDSVDIEQLFGLKEFQPSSTSQKTDSQSMESLSADVTADIHSNELSTLDDVINIPVLKSPLQVSTPNLEYVSPSRSITSRGPIRFKYCTALDQRKVMRHKVILKGLSWLLRCVRNDWSKLELRVCTDSAQQRERELLERRERSEQVRLIREQREREKGAQLDRPQSAKSPANPFLPISRAVERAELREQTITHVQDTDDTPPPDSEEALAIISQYFQNAYSKLNTPTTDSILGMDTSLYVKHVSSDPVLPSGYSNQDGVIRTLDTIHEGPQKQHLSKRWARNRVAPLELLRPLNSPPSAFLKTFHKSQRKEAEVYPCIPSNPWCRPFTPVHDEELEEKISEIELQSKSLPDVIQGID